MQKNAFFAIFSYYLPNIAARNSAQERSHYVRILDVTDVRWEWARQPLLRHSRATYANVRFLRFLALRGKSWASHMQSMVFPWFTTTYFSPRKYTIFKIATNNKNNRQPHF
jgi:hypothetical protein